MGGVSPLSFGEHNLLAADPVNSDSQGLFPSPKSAFLSSNPALYTVLAKPDAYVYDNLGSKHIRTESSLSFWSSLLGSPKDKAWL